MACATLLTFNSDRLLVWGHCNRECGSSAESDGRCCSSERYRCESHFLTITLSETSCLIVSSSSFGLGLHRLE